MFGLPDATKIRAAYAKYEAAKAALIVSKPTDPDWDRQMIGYIDQMFTDMAAAFPKQQVMLGKRPKRVDARTLKIEKYLAPDLPAPPDAFSGSRGYAGDWGMMLNDHYGCCTIAAVAHAVQAWVASQIDPTVKNWWPIKPDDVAVLNYYERWCGYNPNDPTTDAGGVELDILNLWRKEGFEGFGILGYVAVDPQNTLHVKQTIAIFGGAYIGLELPMSTVDQEEWDVVPDDGGTRGGHAVFIVDYDTAGLTCITWGRLLKMSWEFFAKYCSEAYAIVSADFKNPSFDQAALLADLQEVTA